MGVACTVGIKCILQFDGRGLATNRIGLVADANNDHVCDGSLSTIDGLTNPANTTSNELGTASTSFLGSITAPLPYALRICWDQDTSNSQSLTTNFLVNLGTLIFYGAERISDQRCDLGGICQITVPGAGLADSTLQIAHDCTVSNHTVDWTPSLASVATTDDGDVAVFTISLPYHLTRLDAYDICWKSNLVSIEGEGATRVTLNGQLSVVGPELMHVSCYLDQQCILPMVGVGLTLGGSIKIRKGACSKAVKGADDARIVGINALQKWNMSENVQHLQKARRHLPTLWTYPSELLLAVCSSSRIVYVGVGRTKTISLMSDLSH